MTEESVAEKTVSHTPGPWRVKHMPVAGVWVEAGEYRSIAQLMPHVGVEGNAHLIAASPDLLAELKAFEQLITNDSDDLGFHLRVVPISVDRVKALRAAIAKAEGRP